MLPTLTKAQADQIRNLPPVAKVDRESLARESLCKPSFRMGPILSLSELRAMARMGDEPFSFEDFAK